MQFSTEPIDFPNNGNVFIIQFRSLAIKIFFALLSAVICWEIILELTVQKYPGSVTHPVLGRVTASGYFFHGTEGSGTGYWNSLGMRNPEIPSKQPGEKRVLFLGDSYTEAVQVPEENTFCRLSERLLHASNAKQITTINGGRSGATPAYYAHLASFYNKVISPDLVVIQFNTDDIVGELFSKQRYFFLEEHDGKFLTSQNVGFASANPVTQKFRGLDFLVQFSVLRVGTKNLTELIRGPNQSDPDHPKVNQFNPKLDSNNSRALDWLIAEYKHRYNNVIILYLPTIKYENPTSKLTALEQDLKTICVKNDLTLLNMRPRFVKHFLANHEPAAGFANSRPGSGHLNNLGHRLVSEELLGAIKQAVHP